MKPTPDWHEELYQLLIGHLSEAPFDEGVREMAAIAAYHPETHEGFLTAIQGAYDAGRSGDPDVVEVVNRGNARHVADRPSAVAFLGELRDAYLQRVRIAQEVAAMLTDWNSGRFAQYEIDNRIWDLLTPANIDEVVAATSGEWRERLVDHLREVAEAEGPLISIFGGVYMYQLESDPVRRAEMQAELEREQAADAARFDQVMRPAIRAWARKRSG